MSAAIREEITKRLGVEPICINSALVSAQNRQRLYWTNIPGVQQPEDRGILLRDILETGVSFREKGYALKANYYKTSVANAVDGGHFPAPMAAEPVNVTADGKSVTPVGQGGGVGAKTGLYATPVRVGEIPNAKGDIRGVQTRRI